MKAYIFLVFVGLMRVFSKDAEYHTSEFFGIGHPVSVDYSLLYGVSKRSLGFGERSSEDVDSLLEEIESNLSFNNLDRKMYSNDIYYEEMKEREHLEKKEYIYSSLVKYMAPNYDTKSCKMLLEKCCNILQKRANADNTLRDVCGKQDETCKNVTKYLDRLCKIISEQQTSINEFTEQLCEEKLQECDDLKRICHKQLDQSCKKVKKSCSQFNKKPPSQMPSGDKYVVTHTVLTMVTVVETVFAPNTSIYTETLVKTKTCCSGKTVTRPCPSKSILGPSICETQGETLAPPPTSSPSSTSEQPEPSIFCPAPTQPTSASSAPTASSAAVSSTRTIISASTLSSASTSSTTLDCPPEPEPHPHPHPHPHPKPQPPPQTVPESDCSITVTETITNTPSEGGIESAGHSIQLNGLQKTALICSIIVAMIGVWIAV